MSIFLRKSYVDFKKKFFQKRYILFLSLLSVFSSHGIWLPTYQSIKDILGFGRAEKNTEIAAYTDNFEENRKNLLPITFEELQKDQASQEQEVKQKAAEDLKVIREYIPHYSSILRHPTHRGYLESVMDKKAHNDLLQENPNISDYQVEKMNEVIPDKDKNLSNIKLDYDNIQRRLVSREKGLVDTSSLIYDYDAQVKRLNQLNHAAQAARELRAGLTGDYLIEVSPERVSGAPVLSLKPKNVNYQNSNYSEHQINALKQKAITAAYNALGKDNLDHQYMHDRQVSLEQRVLNQLRAKTTSLSADAYSRLSTNLDFVKAYNEFRNAEMNSNVNFDGYKWQDALDRAREAYKIKKPEIKKPEIKKPEIKKPEIKKPEIKKPEIKLPSGPHKKMRYQTSPYSSLEQGESVMYHDDGMIRPSLANKYAIDSWTTNEELAQQEDNFKRISMIQEMENSYKRRVQEQIISAQKKAAELAKTNVHLEEVD